MGSIRLRIQPSTVPYFTVRQEPSLKRGSCSYHGSSLLFRQNLYQQSRSIPKPLEDMECRCRTGSPPAFTNMTPTNRTKLVFRHSVLCAHPKKSRTMGHEPLLQRPPSLRGPAASSGRRRTPPKRLVPRRLLISPRGRFSKCGSPAGSHGHRHQAFFGNCRVQRRSRRSTYSLETFPNCTQKTGTAVCLRMPLSLKS